MVATTDYPPGTIALYPRQMRFVQDRTKYLLATGGIGSGKSTVAMAKVVSRVNRKELGMVVAPTFPMLRDATLRTLFSLLDQANVPYHYHKTEKRVEIVGSGHEIICRSADDEDSLRGPNLAYVAIDEVGYISEGAWRVLRGRVRESDDGQIWAAGTPKGRNWVWDWWVRGAILPSGEPDPKRRLYRFRTDENPALPRDFVADLGFTGAYAAQELEGEFVGFEGLVYPEFDRETMVKRLPLDDLLGWDCVMGGDVGARNPTAILTILFAGDGRSHILREFYARNLSSSDIVDAFANEYQSAVDQGLKPKNIYIDPSAAGYIADLKRRGLRVTKADNDRRRGVQICQAAIRDGVTVDPSCVNFIAEIESYHYPDGNGTKDDPVKENDHACDAWRYACVGQAQPRKRAWIA